ncbi:hypothetical protein PIB30_088647, partial [Stylosanthes scabra]|nr:hypothetical protein [Stylosanthes scabra]
MENTDAASVYRARVGSLMHQCERFVKVACLKEEDFKAYSETILKFTIELEGQNGLCSESVLDLGEQQGGNDDVDGGVGDPARVRTKGTGAGNDTETGKQKNGLKRRKCRSGGKLGHRRTRCPNLSAVVRKDNKGVVAPTCT